MNQLIEITMDGLEVFAHHGLLPEEREIGQLFRFDIRMSLTACQACSSDDIAATVDCAAVTDRLVAVATSRTFYLLEKLVAFLRTWSRGISGSRRGLIRATKPSPPMPHSVDGVSVALSGSRGYRDADMDHGCGRADGRSLHLPRLQRR